MYRNEKKNYERIFGLKFTAYLLIFTFKLKRTFLFHLIYARLRQNRRKSRNSKDNESFFFYKRAFPVFLNEKSPPNAIHFYGLDQAFAWQVKALQHYHLNKLMAYTEIVYKFVSKSIRAFSSVYFAPRCPSMIRCPNGKWLV